MEEKNLDPKLWILVMLIVALIGCVGTIIGAAIGILPDLMELLSRPTPTAQILSQVPASSDVGRSTPDLPPIHIPATVAVSEQIVTIQPTPHLPRDQLNLSAKTVTHVTLDGTWTVFTVGNHVNDLIFHDSLAWAATDGGVVVWNAERGTYLKFTTLNGLVNNEVEAVAIGPDSAFWFGTRKGVSRYDPANNTWQSFTYWEDGLADDWVRSIIAGSDGALWFGTGGGVSRYDPINDTLQSYTHADGPIPYGADAVTIGVDGALWFGTATGLYRYNPADGTWQSYSRGKGLDCDGVWDLTFGLDGILWLVHGGWELGGDECPGVSRYNPTKERWQTLTISDVPLANRYIYAVASGQDGIIWFGVGHSGLIGGGGVTRYDPMNENWRFFNMTDSVSKGIVYALEVGPDGTVWIGTSDSLIRFQPLGS